MSERSGFFNAKLVDGEYDRIYLAEDFAKYFSNFVSNGIFGGKLNELKVYQSDIADMNVKVLSGYAYINGYHYENDDEISLAIDVANGILNRIDSVVLQWNILERVIYLTVKKGTLATDPSAPTLQRDADIYELKLADIYIKAGATSILQTDITDTRKNIDACGFVKTVADNDLVVLSEEVNKLQKATEENVKQVNDFKTKVITCYESVDKPGCYYRDIEGVIEWLNPPMETGIEYRTFERHAGKPVYQKKLYTAKMTDAKTMSISSGISGNKIISVEGYLVENKSTHYLFPLVTSSAVSISAVISHVDSSGQIVFKIDNSLANYEGFVTIKYVK